MRVLGGTAKNQETRVPLFDIINEIWTQDLLRKHGDNILRLVYATDKGEWQPCLYISLL